MIREGILTILNVLIGGGLVFLIQYFGSHHSAFRSFILSLFSIFTLSIPSPLAGTFMGSIILFFEMINFFKKKN